MTSSSRVALALSATAVLALFTGCGSTLYDAAGVPQLVLQCTNPAVPVACAQGCVAEGDASCGKSCLDCTGANKVSLDPAAQNVCNRNDPALVNHVCDFACDQTQGLVKNETTNACDCANPQQVRCGGVGACADQTPTSCGPSCVDCTDPSVFPVHAHGSPRCDPVAGACAFDCNPTFVKTLAGDGCACDVNQVACGPNKATCVTQTDLVCGASCTNCSAFPIDATRSATAPRCAGDGKGVAITTPCDFTCPSNKPTKSFDKATGQWFCDIATCNAGTEHRCPGDPVCYQNTDAGHCGDAGGCTVCPTPPGSPTGTQATCTASGTGFACNIDCPTGYLRSNGACVQVRATPGSVAGGANHTCVITTANNVMCWGANASGQLAVPAGADQQKPLDVPPSAGLAGASYVAAGGDRTCAIVSGLVKCWGAGFAGVEDQGVTGAIAVAVGSDHVCAIVAGGGVRCWGANDKGQVGDGATAISVLVPTAVVTASGALTGVTQLATKASHTCALAGSSVYCWGANGSSQTGVSAATAAAVPRATQVPGLVATSVAVGGQHSCAGVGGANPVCWGDDGVGQLGSGVTGPARPTPVAADALVKRADTLSLGLFFTCDIKSLDLTAQCCGTNTAAQVGASVNNPEPSAIDVPFGLTAPSLMIAGDDHTCVVTGGVLQCWGSNAHGQLGRGAGAAASSAVPVSPLPQ